MSTVNAVHADGYTFGSQIEALRIVNALLDDVAAQLDRADSGELLIGLGQVQVKLDTIHAEVLRRFNAADGHGHAPSGTPAV